MTKLILLVFCLAFAIDASAAGTTIVLAVAGSAWVAANAAAAAAIAFAINMVVSTVISKAFFSPSQPDAGSLAGSSPNPGNRQQVPPASDNKLPVVYGQAYVGGTITDLTISSNNQILYYVISLCEVTSTNNGQTPDNITFGDIYYGGKKVIFNPENGLQVKELLDESTGLVQKIDNRIIIYLYSNGSFSPVNSGSSAIDVMSNPMFTYKWDSTKLMSNTCFAILGLEYSQDLNIRGLEQTKFQITNSRSDVGDCFYDYLVNTRYGAAIPPSQVDVASLNALSAYANELMTFTPYTGGTATQQRFRFNGVLDTNRSVLDNLQSMASCADCLIKYDEILAKWAVIVQKPTYTVAMDVNDSNMVSAISISPMDIAASYNVVECKFPDKTTQDAFNTATLDLANVAPELLYPNEPVNKMSLSLPLTNNSVTAQYIATRNIKSAREDLQVQVDINFVGIQLSAGDIVTITNANYGWVAKLFRLNKVVQTFSEDGSIVVRLTMTEFNPAVFNDVNVTQFTPAPNTGIGSPLTFGLIDPPTIAFTYPNAADPAIVVSTKTASSGITQYIELWYSAYQFPTNEQLLFAGISEVQPSGQPYNVNTTVPNITLTNYPAGTYYFFSRMVNSLGKSPYSLASTALNWRPTTFQYTERYLSVAYADSITGTGFSLSPSNKSFFGLQNTASQNPITTNTGYTWYPANPVFGTSNYLLFANRSNRKFSFATGNAAYLGIGAAFVPTETTLYDQTIWSGLESGDNHIDLDARTGQVTRVGTTSVSSADGLLSVTNNTNGTMVVSLEKFLNFGNGVYSKTVTPSQLTIDIYGRVVGFVQQDDFFYTSSVFNATAGQTVFSVSHIVGQCLVFRNGLLLPSSDYTETTTTVTMTTACAVNEKIQIISMRVVSFDNYYSLLGITIVSSTSTTVTYTGLPNELIKVGYKLAFSDGGTTYTVSAIDTTTKVITFSTTIAGATAGNNIYNFRATGASYAPFSRYEVDVSNISSYTPTTFDINNGFEEIFVNGSGWNEIDYDFSGNTINGFPSNVTGKIVFILYTPNNLGVPCSNITNNVAYSAINQVTYPFTSNPLSFELSANGVMLVEGASYDYTASDVSYNLVTPFTNNFTLLNQQTFARLGAA